MIWWKINVYFEKYCMFKNSVYIKVTRKADKVYLMNVNYLEKLSKYFCMQI